MMTLFVHYLVLTANLPFICASFSLGSALLAVSMLWYLFEVRGVFVAAPAPAPAFSMPTPQSAARPMQRVESYTLVIAGIKLVESLRIVAMQEA